MADNEAVQAWKHWCPTVVMKHPGTGQEVTCNADEASKAAWIGRGYKFERDGRGRPDPSAPDVPAELHIPDLHAETGNDLTFATGAEGDAPKSDDEPDEGGDDEDTDLT